MNSYGGRSCTREAWLLLCPAERLHDHRPDVEHPIRQHLRHRDISELIMVEAGGAEEQRAILTEIRINTTRSVICSDGMMDKTKACDLHAEEHNVK